jgi:hypothetical protein
MFQEDGKGYKVRIDVPMSGFQPFLIPTTVLIQVSMIYRSQDRGPRSRRCHGHQMRAHMEV